MTTTRGSVGRLVGGRYVLEAPIGRGGMGEVWRARHATLASPVAIKFLHATSAESESSRRRFLTEAQVTANLKTKHAVQVFDFGVTDEGLPFLVMELLEGETLERRISRQGRLPVAETARILQTAARALERAHQLGIVHRDFKPENVMLVRDEEEAGESVKVVDFGVAKLVRAPDPTLRTTLASLAKTGARPPTSMSISSTGLGTPFYMAPEQVQDAADVGPAADVWAFGVVAYECLTGRRPFDGDNVGELLLRILASRPPRAASTIAPVPVAFDTWFQTACSRDPARRFPDIHAAADALGRALAPGEGQAIDTGSGLGESPRAESLLPPEQEVTPEIVAAPTISGPRSIRRRLAVVALLAVGALAIALRDARSVHKSSVTAAPVLIPVARAADAEPSDDEAAVAPAPPPAAEPEPASPSTAIAEPPAPPRTRPTRAHRLPPLGF